MRKILSLALFAAMMGGAVASAAPMSWDEADRQCKGLGSNCCATADESGNPKMRDGSLVCHCGLVAGTNPTTAQRITLGRLVKGNTLVKARVVGQSRSTTASPVGPSKMKTN